MSRVKRGTVAHKKRKKILQQTKGFRWGRNSKYRLAKDALRHAWAYAYRDRRVKKRTFRQGWQRTISGALAEKDLNYSRLMNGLKNKDIQIDRKILSQLAKDHPEAFSQIVEKVK